MHNDIFTLGNMKAEPGEKCSGFLDLADGKFKLPVTILNGEKKGKTMLILSGVHAGEYVGIQAAIELSEKLDIKNINGTVIIVKVVCRDAFECRGGSQGVEDGKNLNREFPGKPDGTATQQLAWAITQILFPVANYCIDLHSGDNYEQLTPYVYYAGEADKKIVDMSRKMAEQADVNYMVRSTVIAGGAYNYAAYTGIPSVLIERGGMGGWTKEEVHSALKDVQNILCFLGIYNGQSGNKTCYPHEVVDIRYVSASVTGCWYPCKTPGDIIQRGEALGVVKDYEGNVLENCNAECSGVVLYQTGSLQVLENGPMIAYGRVLENCDDRKDRIIEYWEKRSESFMMQRRRELKSPLAYRWQQEIEKKIPKGKTLKILDVGCGSGFFSILLAKMGHEVTGTDLTPQMIVNSKCLAEEEHVFCHFLVMDAERMEFEDNSFDVVISRNLTWTLPHVKEAYSEWKRILKVNGILLNIDANYGSGNFTDSSELPENHAHHTLGDKMLEECERIKQQLPISSCVRPAWDVETLGQIGFRELSIDLGIGRRIYIEKDEFYNPTPIFMIWGRKSE